jgi:hypothetical protein
MATRTITGLFDRYDDAAQAVRALEATGIPARDISLVANNIDGSAKSIPTTEAGTGAETGAAVGGVAGGVTGVLAGLGMLAIPGIGPVVAAGWLVVAAVGALAGATVGAAAGGLGGTLIAAGVSRDDANFYVEGVRRGGTVVTVKTNEEHAGAVERIVAARAVNIAVRGKLYRDMGWREFDPAAIPFTPAEVETERLRYRSAA